jgi:hypothetical protein
MSAPLSTVVAEDGRLIVGQEGTSVSDLVPIHKYNCSAPGGFDLVVTGLW